MSSVLHFSPAFKSKLSVAGVPSSPRESSKKRKRGLESLENNGCEGGGEVCEAKFAANGTGLPSESPNAFVTTAIAAPDIETSHGYNAHHSQISGHTNYEGSHVSGGPQPFPHHITETAPSKIKGRISDELATLKPPLYVAARRVPTATAEKISGSTGLRQHHLKTMTAVLHRCLLERDYIRAGRAWATLLRAEQHGQSMDLRTHNRWGVGAEILMQRESQMAQSAQDHKFEETSKSTLNLRVKSECLEKAREYYERVVLQYPYRNAFPNITVALDFTIALFSLWLYTVYEWSSTASTIAGCSNEDNDGTDAEVNVNVQSWSASDNEPDRYQTREQVEREALKGAYEIAAGLNGLLVSPPYSDKAKLWNLCGEISLWIADLSIGSVVSICGFSTRGDDRVLTMGSSSPSRNASRSISLSKKHRVGQERQKALAKAEEAFQRAKVCGPISAE